MAASHWNETPAFLDAFQWCKEFLSMAARALDDVIIAEPTLIQTVAA